MTREEEIEARLDWLERAVILLGSGADAPDLPPRPGSSGFASRPGVAAGGTAAEGVPQEVLVFLEAGKKIHAIEAYRKATGVGLKEAKAQVERLERLSP